MPPTLPYATLDQVIARGANPTIYFRSFVDRDLFVSLCPKSLRVRSSHCAGGRVGDYGLSWINGAAPTASISIARTVTRHREENQKTGAQNESGVDRLGKFLRAIESHLTVLESFSAPTK
jgi:hypothetical protein